MKRHKKSVMGRLKISTQLVLVYFCAIFLPIVAIGSYLVYTVNDTQRSYYEDLLQAYNDGIEQTIYEITTQIMTISESIVYNDDLIDFLNGEYETEQDMRQAAANTTLLDKYAAKYVGVEEICIYIDREDMINYGQFYKVTDEIRESDWYQKAGEQYIPFWMAYESEATRGGNLRWNLTLVRKMILVGGDREAVIMIKVRDSYLSTRLTNSRYTTMISVDDQTTAFASTTSLYGTKPEVDITYGDETYAYMGNVFFDNADSLVCVNTLKLTKSSNHLYLVSYDTKAMGNIERIIRGSIMIMTVALLLPLVIMMLFGRRFAGQVRRLRDEMGKASRGEYREMAAELVGSEELADAFTDLQKMVHDIQRMEAEQYEAQIRAQNILNDQQRIEFKMLSNQINPHFLYNTLETIRMKALAAGDTEVANATKLLGKSMRYVLENTGTKDTTLQKEIDHILIYLQIQKLRFGDRVNYQLDIQPGLVPEEQRMLPLLLQPVVENAIVHGLEGRESDGMVWIAIYKIDCENISDSSSENSSDSSSDNSSDNRQDGCENVRTVRPCDGGAAPAATVLHIDISDNGNGMTAEELEELKQSINSGDGEFRTSSIGLNNINRRIKLSYGSEYGLSIESTYGEGTRVSVTVPAV